MQFSQFGQQFSGQSGILQLMDDLGKALAGAGDVIMLGGGNPAYITEVQTIFRREMYELLRDEGRFERMVGDYAPPEGHLAFLEALAGLLRDACGWDVGPQNIALTNGSQTAFFYLFNLFGGVFPDGSFKRILLPLAPEYIGYADVGLAQGLFVAQRPEIQHLDDRLFKYRVDFDALHVGEDIGAICVSRPTNPTGNVLTDGEVAGLSELARNHDIPLIIDNAYGMPFPGIIFGEASPVWDEHIVLCMSLSKLGLPGTRTGIIIANEDVIRAISAMNAVISLSPGNAGAVLVLDLVRSGEILRLSREVIGPFYKAKAEQAVHWLRHYMGDTTCYIHKPEGAFFLWLWFEGLPITTKTLYERLKQRGVIVVPGEYFFPGISEPWRHTQECIRMSYAQAGAVVEAGIKIIAEEVKRAYDQG